MKKLKIQLISDDLYQVVQFEENEDEVFLEVLLKGTLQSCENFIQELEK